jgi:hypothetical protein
MGGDILISMELLIYRFNIISSGAKFQKQRFRNIASGI